MKKKINTIQYYFLNELKLFLKSYKIKIPEKQTNIMC